MINSSRLIMTVVLLCLTSISSCKAINDLVQSSSPAPSASLPQSNLSPLKLGSSDDLDK